jgi:hypothetical protein
MAAMATMAAKFAAAGCDAGEMLELVDGALDEMAFVIELLVERELHPRRMRRVHCLCLFGGDVVSKVARIIGRVGEDISHAQSVDQRVGFGDVVAPAARKDEAHPQLEAAHGEVNLGRRAAARAPNGVILCVPFASATCWCARTIVESMIA